MQRCHDCDRELAHPKQYRYAHAPEIGEDVYVIVCKFPCSWRPITQATLSREARRALAGAR